MASNYFYGLGRRKRANARVRLSSKKGAIEINSKTLNEYLNGSKFLQSEILKPFNSLELDPDDFSLSVKVNGGGHSSQVDAIKLGLAKALVELNADFRATLKKAELLSRDSREKERKKFGFLKARKKRQYTKR